MDREIIIKILLVISLIVLVIFLLWFMLGDSLTLEQIFVLFILPVGGAFFGAYEKLNNKIINIRLHLQQELGEIKQSLGKIEGRLSR